MKTLPKFSETWSTHIRGELVQEKAEDMDKELERTIFFYQNQIIFYVKSSRKLNGSSIDWEKAQWAKKVITIENY